MEASSALPSDVRVINVQKYYTRPDPAFRGNPLVEVLPEIDESLMRQALTQLPALPESLRAENQALRLARLQETENTFLPLTPHLQMAMSLMAATHSGYKGRNPRRKNADAEHFAFAEALASGQLSVASNLQAPKTLTLIGTPGMGKSQLIRAYEARFGHAVFIHDIDGLRVPQVPIVVVECTRDDGISGMLHALYQTLLAFAKAARVQIALPPSSTRTIGTLQVAIALLAKVLNVGMLVVDEIQHLAEGSSSTKSKESVMRFLTGFQNALGTPVCLVGTWKAYLVLSEEFRSSRRAVGQNSVTLGRLKRDDPMFASLLKFLCKFELVQIRTTLDKDLVDAFHDETQGVIDLVVKLFAIAQRRAIKDKSEALTPDGVRQAAREAFAPLSIPLRQMREGVRDGDPLYFDLEPDDLEAYLIALHREDGSAKRRPAKAAGMRRALPRKQTRDIGLALQPNDDASPEEPKMDAPTPIRQTPISASPPHRATVHLLPARTDKRAYHEALDSDDIRRVVYFAISKQPKDEQPQRAHDALMAAGHISRFAHECGL